MSFLCSSTTQVLSQWIQTNGPYDGPVQALAVSGCNLFVGTDRAGVYLSTNNGVSWKAVNNGLRRDVEFQNVHALEFLGSYLFAGTNGGIFLSTNNGASWSSVNSGIHNASVNRLTTMGSNLFAATDRGVFLSVNSGKNWICVGFQDTCVTALTVSDSSLYAGTGTIPPGSGSVAGGVFLTTNDGTTWRKLTSGTSVEAMVALSSDLFVSIYAAGVFLTKDSGTTWIRVNEGLFHRYGNPAAKAFAISGPYLFIGTDRGVYRSDDKRTTWTEINDGLLNATIVHALAANSSSLFAGTSRGLWRLLF